MPFASFNPTKKQDPAEKEEEEDPKKGEEGDQGAKGDQGAEGDQGEEEEKSLRYLPEDRKNFVKLEKCSEPSLLLWINQCGTTVPKKIPVSCLT